MSVLCLLDAAVAAEHTATPLPTGVYDPRIASDGLTLDTLLGPVDLVAINRAVRGADTALSLAERAWIALRQPRGARHRAAAALGVDYPRWHADLLQARTRIDTHSLATTIAAAADQAWIQAARLVPTALDAASTARRETAALPAPSAHRAMAGNGSGAALAALDAQITVLPAQVARRVLEQACRALARAAKRARALDRLAAQAAALGTPHGGAGRS
jgi:hypothetical protein